MLRLALFTAAIGSTLATLAGLILAPVAGTAAIVCALSGDAEGPELALLAVGAPLAGAVLVALGVLGLLGARGVRRGDRRWIWSWLAAAALLAVIHPLATALGALLITGFAQALCAAPRRRSAPAPAASPL